MSTSSVDTFATTCWAVVRAAAKGESTARETFAWRYEPVVRAYLSSRWTTSRHRAELDDAVQEVFLECFRDDGALVRASARSRFRTFLYAVTRNVARRVEERAALRQRKVGGTDPLELQIASDDESSSRVFDRVWAEQIIQQARGLLEQRAGALGERALRRTEILKLRFHENRAIRDIAVEWGVEAAFVHHEYAKARTEFTKALRDVVSFHQPGVPEGVDRECERLLSLLRS